MNRARIYRWTRMRRYIERSSDAGPSLPRQFCPAYIINTRGYDFREGQVLVLSAPLLPRCCASSCRFRFLLLNFDWFGIDDSEHVQHAGGRLERGRALLRRVAVVLYALLMPKARRQRLAAYFTPPHLADHAIRAMIDAGIRPGRHRILDPASGGAAFLVPLAARIAESGHKRGARAAGRSHLSPRHLAQSGAAGATVSPLL